MDHLEMVERLRQRANVSYEEARAALEKSNWDMLDAMVELERAGKARPGAAYDTASGERSAQYEPVNATASTKRAHTGWKNFCDGCKSIFRKSWVNSFCVSRDGQTVLTMPILLMLFLVLFCFWVLLPLLIIGLFFGCRYSFAGEDVKSVDVNKVMDKAADCATDIKENLRSNLHEDEQNKN